MVLRCSCAIRIDVGDLCDSWNEKRCADTKIVTISSLTVTNSRRRTILNVTPNAFPATRVSASRDLGDNSIVEYVQVHDFVQYTAGR